MANVSLKTDFKDGDKLYDYELNNNFRAIKAALEAMNKITWQDNTEGVGVSAYKGDTDAIEARDLIDGQLLYNTETGETYIDTYIDDTLTRINTGSGNVVAIQDDEPTNDAVKLWIETDTLDGLDSEIVNEYSESENLGYSADYVNKKLIKYASIELRKTTDQTFDSDTYDNKLTWDTIFGNTGLTDKIYLSSGDCYITPKVKKIDVTFNLQSENPVSNMYYGLGGRHFYTILNSSTGPIFGNKMSWSLENNNQVDAQICFNIYEANTIYGNDMWTYAIITIAYED